MKELGLAEASPRILYGGDNLHHQKKHVRVHDDNQYKLPSIKSSLSQKVIDGRGRLFERF